MSRTVTVGMGRACCAGVLCEHGDPARVGAALGRGGDSLLVRGVDEGLAELAARARAAGFSEVIAATAGLDRAGERERLAGADVVRAVIFSHVPRVHDRLAGREGALVGALVGLRALAADGVPLEVEAPLLPARLSSPRAVVELVARAIGRPRAVRFYVPRAPVPGPVAPPRFDAVGPALSDAIGRAGELGVEVSFDPSQGVVPCAFEDASLHARFQFARGIRPARGEPCVRCAARASCVGPTDAYRAAHGQLGLRPFDERPTGLRGRTDARRPTWGAAEREAARHVRFVVFRPTVHCNQDCLFCSANESSNNVWSEPKAMMKAISRAASRGVGRISFSGGEPTLSPHLPSFVSVASRCGIPEVEIVTNGVLLDRADRVRRLTDAGLTHAFVSLHAHDEALSRAMTQKEGDHERTLSAIGHLLDAGVEVAVNHVITTRNQPYLRAYVERIAERFAGRVLISFAFVTPQYKALEHPELVPRLSDTMPHLHRAMHRALELGQPFVVGSRQGVPPCFLGPYQAWSDVFSTTNEAASEDTPQKIQGEICATCRYANVCQGLWRPYAARHGTSELRPVLGAPFDEAELSAIRGHHRAPPWGVPRSFDEAPPLLRDLAGEVAPPPAAPKVSLPVFVARRTRPLRVLLVGTGSRARRLAEASAHVEGFAMSGVVSPHALERPSWWGAVPAFADLAEALDATRPEAVLIAAATDVHVELSLACEVPVLLEKPVALRSTDAEALAGRWITCAIQGAFARGVGPLRAPGEGPVLLRRRCAASAPDAPPWSRKAIAETLHHALSLPVLARGPLVSVASVRFAGGARPSRLLIELMLEAGAATIELDYDSPEDSVRFEAGGREWLRRGELTTLDGGPAPGDGSEMSRMLAAFRAAVLEGGPPPLPVERGAHILDATERVVRALAEAGAPLDRPGAPKHVASKRYRTSGSHR